MNSIYLVRHAESVANTRGVYQGQTYDTSLSPLGQLQAKALANFFTDYAFDRIITSPLLRTLQTTDLITKTNRSKPILDQRIIEANHGLWEGKSKAEIARLWPHIYSTWQSFPSQTAFPGGEFFSQTQQRVLAWWQEVSGFLGNTLVVSHINIIQIVLAHLDQVHLDMIWNYRLQPTSVTIIENGRIKLMNHSAHLNGLQSNLSVHAL